MQAKCGVVAVFIGFSFSFSVPVIKYHDKSNIMGKKRFILADSLGGTVHHGGKVVVTSNSLSRSRSKEDWYFLSVQSRSQLQRWTPPTFRIDFPISRDLISMIPKRHSQRLKCPSEV